MKKIYKSRFTKPIEINTPKEAVYVIMNFCDYCKGGGDKDYCTGYRASVCETTINQIIKDFSK